MFLEILPSGILDTNTYIVSDGKDCIIIDAGNTAQSILQVLKKHDWTAKYLILTHGHYDHIFYADEIRKTTGAQLIIHSDDVEFLENPFFNGAAMFEPTTVSRPEKTVSTDETLEVGSMKVKFIHTPGHTPGCMCILVENSLFTGDTLFSGSIGRTDFPGGDFAEIIDSIKTKLLTLDESVVVYPGHGPKSTIAKEKKTNPFLTGRI